MKIYLIGGPPKCGKTTLSKHLSRKLGIAHLSSDTLESVLQYYLTPENFPKNKLKGNSKISNDEFYSIYSPEEIRDSYIQQSKTSYKAIRSIVETSLIEEDSIIIEGFHITPELVHELETEFGEENIDAIFLIKTDTSKFIKDIHKSQTPNDWILQKTKEESTFRKIASMIVSYAEYFKTESEKYNLEYIDMSEDFEDKINTYVQNKSI